MTVGYQQRFIRTALLSLCMLILLGGESARADQWGPWSVSGNAPVLLTTADREVSPSRQREKKETGIAATPFVWLLRIYQNFISPVKGDRCPMYPTCSQYSVLAFQKHGPLIGLTMTADRLIHELDEQDFVPFKRIGDRYRFLDPVENNDFWWYEK